MAKTSRCQREDASSILVICLCGLGNAHKKRPPLCRIDSLRRFRRVKRFYPHYASIA